LNYFSGVDSRFKMKVIAIVLLCVGAALALPTKVHNDAGRVVGGEEVEPHSRPFQVAIKIGTPDGTAFCGGTLISTEYVLTAAHCADIAGALSFEVVLGAHNISDTAENTQVSVTVAVADALVHPEWNMAVLQNDLALLRLSTPVTLSDNIQTLRLPAKSLVGNLLVNENATVSGWGKYDDDINSISPVLRKVTKNVITRLACNSRYVGVIKPTHLCTSGTQGQSSCSGDSGGPLTIVEADGEPTQVGIVSFGFSLGCELGWPAVYTRVTEYIDWISETANIPLRE